ncbi:(deoxy)nucleoside triphosphate pyrophosphohydrolase [Brevibacterium sp.]|uniref:(deoxy)nucleoside triphosphate pyrophosphohydrolase n=1 Tax=Brevibacterium sp. TaxID=1701 RepID=UPI002811105A|nr:(deoxy)nucleoside triphosphate pyrophosphohydrolase [Brevibacterium sp.]
MSEALQVVGAVLHRDGQVLACRRSPHKAEGGKWEFPGGKIEPGESPKSALRRELEEELGLVSVSVGDLLTREVSNSNGQSIDLACYWAQASEFPVVSTDHDELRWCSIYELSDLDWAVADLPTVNALQTSATTDTKAGSVHE